VAVYVTLACVAFCVVTGGPVVEVTAAFAGACALLAMVEVPRAFGLSLGKLTVWAREFPPETTPDPAASAPKREAG
jgi:hypothetical protein